MSIEFSILLHFSCICVCVYTHTHETITMDNGEKKIAYLYCLLSLL